ncbi:MAG: hypothetical protein QOK37_1282 [Thermoanaerobaculia bacterium]|jgi:type III secretory pathway component EscV/tetratricopeptide (TPR) repeat protein|nr:hypothetical protein [Thermoanaerobaculia bacterium]
MSERTGVQVLFAAARAATERSHADPAMKDVFDTMAEKAALDPFDFWNALDDQIGRAVDPALQQRLIALRSSYVDQFIESECRRLQKAGWGAFLAALAETITRFRLDFALRLCECPLKLDEPERRRLDGIRDAVQAMRSARWPRGYRLLSELATLEYLPHILRAQLLVILGQIQQFHFGDTPRAKAFYDQALTLAPDEFHVLASLGDYYYAESRVDEASAHYERAINAAPVMSEGYIGMGKVCELKNDIAGAERFYRKAIEVDSGSSNPVSKLLRLYARPELYEVHVSQVVALKERAIAVDPSGEYQAYLDLAYVYEQNERLDDAATLYQKALLLDPQCPDGYTLLGHLYQEQSRNSDARRLYENAIEAVDGLYDVYRALITICEERQSTDDAQRWRGRLESVAIAALPDAAWGDVTAVNVLELLASDYKTQRDAESSRRIYDALHSALGSSYSATYHNWLGNLHYYLDEDAPAVEEYERAVAASPNDPLFHRNLAEAYKNLKRYEDAASSYNAALDLDGDRESYNSAMSLLLNAEGNDLFADGRYEESTAKYTAALDFDVSNAVVWSNLAGAWQEVEAPAGKTVALIHAMDALKQAFRIDPEYADDVALLERKLIVARTYGDKALDRVHVVAPLIVEFAADLKPFLIGKEDDSIDDLLLSRIEEMRAAIENEIGVFIPGVRFRLNGGDLASGVYVIQLREVPLVSSAIRIDRRLFPGPAAEIESLGVSGEAAVNPQTNAEAMWIASEDWGKLRDAHRPLWEPAEYLVQHLEAVIRNNILDFAGHSEIAAKLAADAALSGIVTELAKTEGKLSALTAVCIGLLAEALPIKPLDQIYAVFDRLYSKETPLFEIVEAIRSSVLRARVSEIDPRYAPLTLGPRFETEIGRSIYRHHSHAVLAMSVDSCSVALSAVREAVKDRESVLVVKNAESRPFVRALTELEFPRMPVVSQAELSSNARLNEIEAVEVDTNLATRRKERRAPRNRAGVATDVDTVKPAGSEIGITVYLSDAINSIPPDSEGLTQAELFATMQDGLFYDLGLQVPDVRVEIDSTLGGTEFRFTINGEKYPKVTGLKGGEYFVTESVDRLALLGVKARSSVNPATGVEAAVVRQSDMASERARSVGLTTWEPLAYVMLVLAAAVRKRAASFQTVAVTHYMLDKLEQAFPDLIRAAMARFEVDQIAHVLQHLLEEEISIRDLRGILEGILSVNGTLDVDLSRFVVLSCHTDNLFPVGRDRELGDLTAADYADAARTALKRYITFKYGQTGSSLHAYLLNPDIENRIRSAGNKPLTATEIEKLKAALRNEIRSLPSNTPPPALLTNIDVRRATRMLIAGEFPQLPVLTYQELSPDANIQVIARISWD